MRSSEACTCFGSILWRSFLAQDWLLYPTSGTHIIGMKTTSPLVCQLGLESCRFSGRYPWAIETVLKEYGDVVRIAPNELVFFNPRAQTDILMGGTGKRPTFIKTDFQHIGGEHAGIAADPDVEKHRAVRKMLAPAFNPRALREQEPALHDHINRFISQLEKFGGTQRGVDMREVHHRVPAWFFGC